MDAVSYSHSAKQAQRIEKFIKDPDSSSGIVTVPKVIASGESVTIPAGRVAILPDVQVDGTLNVEGDVFIPSGATFGDLESQIAGKVSITGEQTIDGIKTFVKSPIVPTPTTGTQAVNKDYADLKVALASFVGTNQSLSASGYQKLPGGLIIQWGTFTQNNVVDLALLFPVTFPNWVGFVTVAMNTRNGGADQYVNGVIAYGVALNGFTSQNHVDSNGNTFRWLAIGF